MARRTPALARAFAGRWRIVEMDQWEDLDLLEPAHITFTGKDSGELVFVAVEADLDVRYGSRDGMACAEFSGRAPTTIPLRADAGGSPWAPQAASSDISSSTKVMIPGLSPSANDISGNRSDAKLECR